MPRRKITRRLRKVTRTRRPQPPSAPTACTTQLATVTAPVLLIAGEVDLNSTPSIVAELADLFPNAELVVQPGAGHFPWVDDPAVFVATTAGFLG